MGGRSKLADKLLLGMHGIEIGGASHNAFGLQTINIDHFDRKKQLEQQFSDYLHTNQNKLDNEKVNRFQLDIAATMRVDVLSEGDALPYDDNKWDFVIGSHILEHFHDPIKALFEWHRVTKPGGYIFQIVPHKERTFEKDKHRTTLQELIDRHNGKIPEPIPRQYGHQNVWITEDLIELCDYLKLNLHTVMDPDDKVGNGFTIVIQK
jgi:SAM-dependent methyltransferase